ncbi:MAG: MerR family transcriptional regulator [Bryobacteraceae bacterium]|nr:MerR family transcriptional regulator [Bryobacteraceae bacterium]
MTIGGLSQRTGVPASTIRFWERVGVLPQALRIGGQRRYPKGAEQRVFLVRLAQGCGFTLEETALLLNGFTAKAPPSKRWQRFAALKEAELDGRIAQLEAMRDLVHRVSACQCPDWAECARMAEAALRLEGPGETA